MPGGFGAACLMHAFVWLRCAVAPELWEKRSARVQQAHKLLAALCCRRWFEYLCAWLGSQAGQGDPIEW